MGPSRRPIPAELWAARRVAWRDRRTEEARDILGDIGERILNGEFP